MRRVQCRDDGVTSDIRLVATLRRHGASDSFNLDAGLHEAQRRFGRVHQGSEVWRLARHELREVYAGVCIARHSLTHPGLDPLTPGQARHEVAEGRDRLQQSFGQPVRGFADPFGAWNATVAAIVRDRGHCDARTPTPADPAVPNHDPMAWHRWCELDTLFDR